ncbi:MAG: hypothetical protein HY815_08920 [Candidatus Riflebacteria bacterium]|nr:hypothetical protein [Candidatus Riflebacteria bacterium]
MRPGRVTCLLTAIFFAWSVLAPAPLAAAQASRLSGVKEFLIKDWERTRSDLRRVGEFLARDFARTKADLSAVRSRLASLKLVASSKDRGDRMRELMQGVRERLVDRLDATIDEMGVREFAAMVARFTGKPVVAAGEDADGRLMKARLVRSFDQAFQTVTDDMARKGPGALVDAVREADDIVEQIGRGATPGQVAEVLQARHLGPGGDRDAVRKVGFFRALGKVLNTLFMVASCGALSLVSLGFMAYGLTTGGLFFTATGGAAVAACLYGMVFYVARCIKELHGAAPFLDPESAFAMGVAL